MLRSTVLLLLVYLQRLSAKESYRGRCETTPYHSSVYSLSWESAPGDQQVYKASSSVPFTLTVVACDTVRTFQAIHNHVWYINITLRFGSQKESIIEIESNTIHCSLGRSSMKITVPNIIGQSVVTLRRIQPLEMCPTVVLQVHSDSTSGYLVLGVMLCVAVALGLCGCLCTLLLRLRKRLASNTRVQADLNLSPLSCPRKTEVISTATHPQRQPSTCPTTLLGSSAQEHYTQQQPTLSTEPFVDHVYEVVDEYRVSPCPRYENIGSPFLNTPYVNFAIANENQTSWTPPKHIPSYVEPEDIHPLKLALYKATVAKEYQDRLKKEKERQAEAINRLHRELKVKNAMKKMRK
ncbi:uncharacterized protein [Procambarus clarkii]|uniref:uncharacterized protein n=1 Tax=Procambarus clarkii TaxID=6728 RepID=UPI0037441072